MAEENEQDILVMAIFMVTRNDVLICADELGVSREQITDDVVEGVKEEVSRRIGKWGEAVSKMVKETLGEKVRRCLLGMACSPSCAFRQAGGCELLKEVG
ncbi:MAG: hypothetical protein V3R96_03920 [Dehalococcoidales bacterium]